MTETSPPHTRGETPEHRSTALAELAHESLVDAWTATLYVEGVGFVDEDAAPGVTLGERHGRPVLLCPADARLTRVAAEGCTAVLTVPACEAADGVTTIVFVGRLHRTRTYGAGDERTAMLELAPASIVVESLSGRPERVDLASYTARCRRASGCARAEPVADAEMRRAAERIRVHTNQHHALALAGAVGRLTGQRGDAVAGASLAALTPSGAELQWTDERGGHRIALSFRTAAHDPASLSRSLRTALEGSAGSGR